MSMLYLADSNEGIHELSNSTSKTKSFNISHIDRCTEINSILDVQIS